MIHRYAVEKLDRWLSLWESGELPDPEERELSDLVGNLREEDGLLDSVADSLSSDSRERLRIYTALEDLKLSDSECARLDSIVESLAEEDRKRSKFHFPKLDWLRISVIASVACVLLLFGMILFFENDIHFGKRPQSASLILENDSLDGQVSKMMAMESGKYSMRSVSSARVHAPATVNSKTVNSKKVNAKRSSRSKVRNNKRERGEVIESDWERCKRLLKEMDLNSTTVSREALIMLNNDFDGNISTKVVVSDMLQEMAPLNVFTM